MDICRKRLGLLTYPHSCALKVRSWEIVPSKLTSIFTVQAAQTREVRPAGVDKLFNSFSAEGLDLRNPTLGEVVRVAAPTTEVIDNFPEPVMSALGFATRQDLREHGVFYRLIGGNHRNEALRRMILDPNKSPLNQQRFPLELKVHCLEYAPTSTVTEVLLSEKSNNIKDNQVIIWFVVFLLLTFTLCSLDGLGRPDCV